MKQHVIAIHLVYGIEMHFLFDILLCVPSPRTRSGPFQPVGVGEWLPAAIIALSRERGRPSKRAGRG
jgi:hypothetical protein